MSNQTKRSLHSLALACALLLSASYADSSFAQQTLTSQDEISGRLIMRTTTSLRAEIRDDRRGSESRESNRRSSNLGFDTVTLDDGAQSGVGAVGNGQVLTTSSTRIVVHSEEGQALTQTRNAAEFWGPVMDPGERLSNPQTTFDHDHGRFIMVSSIIPSRAPNAFLDAGVAVAVSRTGDATGTWDLYRLPLHDAATHGLQTPKLGETANAYWISSTAHAHEGSEVLEDYLHLSKENLFQGLWQAVPRMTVVPGRTLYPTTWEMIKESDDGRQLLYSATDVRGEIMFAQLEHDGSELTMVRDIARVQASHRVRPDAPVLSPQPGRTGALECRSMGDGVVADGSLILALNAYLPVANALVPSIQVLSLDTKLRLNNETTIEGRSELRSFLCPSVARNELGDVLIGFSSASPTQFVSAGYAFRWADSPWYTLEQATLYRAGSAPMHSPASLSTGSAVVGANGIDLWTMQAYGARNGSGAYAWAGLRNLREGDASLPVEGKQER